MRCFFFVPVLPFFTLFVVGRDGGGLLNERVREDDVEDAEHSSSEEDVFFSSALQAEVALDELKERECADLSDLVDALNSYCKKAGYRTLHLREKRDSKAYYACGCKQNKCFYVTFQRPVASGKGARKEGRKWSIKSVAAHLCDPHEPRIVALAHTWIPEIVKERLVSLFDQNVGAADAHAQGLVQAAQLGLPTTWERSDVDNFFDTMRRMFWVEDVIPQLRKLAQAGHFVALDVKNSPEGRTTLNMAFVAFESMRILFRLFGSFASIDATYGKNNLQLPVVFFVGLSNEGCIVPFGVAFMRSETTVNYTWLARQFCECHRSLPRTVLMDGDLKIRAAIEDVAREKRCSVAILLCVWHLHSDLERQLLKKTPSVDTFALKKGFYELRSCGSEALFHAKWGSFVETFGGAETAKLYLQKQLFDQRELWVQCWTGRTFCGGMQTTGVSESLHSLIASGRSSLNNLGDILVLVDSIVVSQCEKTLKRTAKHDTALEQLTLDALAGFVLPSVSPLLSGRALNRLRELNVGSCFFSVCVVDPVDASVVRSWRVSDLRFSTGLVHVVSEILRTPANAELKKAAAEIRRVLSKDMDLGRQVCATCRSADEGAFENGRGFQVPVRWELLYPGVSMRKRMCIALGFNHPKEAKSTNNATHEGLLDMLTLYVAHRDRLCRDGLEEVPAHVAARDLMRQHEYGGRPIGVPRFTRGLWIQCGVLTGEDAVPEKHRREYCGLWFHLCCVGLVRAPKDDTLRVQCMRCMQDARYRVKPPKIEQIAKVALWDGHGAPRILQDEHDGRIRTLDLICSCELAVGSGLPCEAMLATARTCGAVLSYYHYNTHWFGGKFINFEPPKPVFDKNQKLQLNVNEVVGNAQAHEAPSHVSKNVGPKRAKVVDGVGVRAEATPVVTEGGVEREDAVDLDGVEPGGRKSTSKRSRRFKPRKN